MFARPIIIGCIAHGASGMEAQGQAELLKD